MKKKLFLIMLSILPMIGSARSTAMSNSINLQSVILPSADVAILPDWQSTARDIEQDKQALRANLAAILAQLDNINDHLTAYPESSLQSTSDSLSLIATDISGEIESATTEDEITSCMGAVSQLQSDVQELDSSVSYHISTINNQKSALQNRLNMLNDRLTSITYQLHDAATESEAPDLYTTLNNLKNEAQSTAVAITNANTFEKLSTIAASITGMEAAAISLQSSIEQYIQQKEQVENERNNMLPRLDNVNWALSDIANRLSPYDAPAYYETLTSLQQESEAILTCVREATTMTDINTCKNRLSALEANCTDLDNNVNNFIERITSSKDNLRNQIGNLSALLGNLRIQLGEKAPDRNDAPELYDRLDNMATTLDDVSDAVETANSIEEINDCMSIINGLMNNIQELRDDIEALEPLINEGFCPDAHHPHLIDLGLPSGTMWACCNIEASSPSKPGGYYAWGETEEKESFSWSNYSLCNGSAETCIDIGDNIAGTDYDVAHHKWGRNWRLPTSEQISELISNNNTTSEWTTVNGQNGRVFTSRSNGNSIFIPAAGYGWNKSINAGCYLTATSPDFGLYSTFYFDSNGVYSSSTDRCEGSTARPVVQLTKDSYIDFKDPFVEQFCVNKWDTAGEEDGFLSYREAERVTALTDSPYITLFGDNAPNVTSFDELQYFINVSSIGADFYNCTNMTSITLPPYLTTISSGLAFFNCKSLTSITIPDSVQTINGNPFKGCSSLESIVVAPGNPQFISRNEVEEECNAIIDQYSGKLIAGCKNTFIPNFVTTIGGDAFSGCEGLTHIYIPSSVTSIATSAFDFCSGLESMYVDDYNDVYYSDSLNSCIIEKTSHTLVQGCKNTVIPNNVTAIGNSAFSGQTGLTEITIPSSVTSIGISAFSCNNLTKVTVDSTTPPTIDGSSFTNRANATLCVPAGSEATYKSADYWKEFKYIVTVGTEPGDANEDGEVNITDLKDLVKGVLKGVLNNNALKENADVNGDNKVDIADITELENIILGK